MANIDFLSHVKSDLNVIRKQHFREQLGYLFDYAKTNGLSAQEQDIIVDIILNFDLDQKTYQNLILCLIPYDTASPKAVQEILIWILMKHELENEYNKTDCLLIWIASLLDFSLVNVKVVDNYYDLLFSLVVYGWKSLSHILYMLTKSEDVTQGRVTILLEIIQKMNVEPHWCVLLRRFKEINSKFSHVTVPTYRKCEKIFSSSDHFYVSLRSNLRKAKNETSVSMGSIIVPFTKGVKSCKSTSLLPPIHYLENDPSSFKIDEIYVHNIQSGAELVKNFNKIVLPLNTLSFLSSHMGIRVLMLSKRTIQDQFLTNLYVLLEQKLIYRQHNTATEQLETLLNNVIELHWMYQQGFKVMSALLSVYLQGWDGYEFKSQIYKLLSWFVFKSNTELNRYLLRPLHTLFVASDAQEQCDILLCLSDLIRNLYSMVTKDEQKYSLIYEENILKTREELIPVIKSLTKFTSELCKIGLYIHPCDNQLLFVALLFYERIHELERLHKMSYWSIISSSVLYQSLFSFNAHLLNQTCGLLKQYRSTQQYSVENSSEKIREKIRRLQSYVQDMFSILWTSKAFVKRTHGHIFRGLSLEDEASWRNYTNLNNSLNLSRHIMFAPYRMLEAFERKSKICNFSKEEVLGILQPHLSHLVDVIEATVEGEREEELDSD